MARSEILVGNSFIVDKDLQTLSSWFESNHLTGNRTKIQALSVGPCDYSLFLSNARIEFLQSIKILGVTLDKDLSYKEHISDQLKKAYAKASALRTVRRFRPRDAMIKLYKAFILLHLEYCSPFFAGIGEGQRSRLEDAWQLLYFEIINRAQQVNVIRRGRGTHRRCPPKCIENTF